MAKYENPVIIDAALGYLQNNANKITIATAQPTTYAQAATTYALGTLGVASGNFTLADGDSTGRKITYGPGTVVVGTSGTVNHIAFVATGGAGTLLFVGTCAPISVTAAGTVVIAAWDVTEIGTVV